MNNQNTGMFIPLSQNNFPLAEEIRNINMQISNINLELKRLERRILNIEKGLVMLPLGENVSNPPKKEPNYTNGNYMI